MTRRTVLVSCTSWIIGAALSTALAEPITKVTITVGASKPEITSLVGVASPKGFNEADPDLRGLRESGKAKSIPYGKPTTIELTPTTIQGVLVLAYTEKKSNGKLELCDSVPIVAGKITVAPKDFVDSCKGSEKRGAVVVRNGTEWLALTFADDPNMNVGSDFGFGLTVNNHWKDGKSFENVSGVAGYFALSSLKSNWFRWIAHVAVLDDDPEQTFEVGLGTGVLLRAKPKDVPDAHFAIAVGVGYNLMLHGDQDPWYTFIGLNYNLDREARSAAKP